MNSLIAMLRELERQRFYGFIEAKFENGQIKIIRKTETYLPQEARINQSHMPGEQGGAR